MSDREADGHTYKFSRFFQVFILLQKLVSDNLRISARSSIVSLADCTQKVPVFDLESPARSSADFFNGDSYNLYCTQ